MVLHYKTAETVPKQPAAIIAIDYSNLNAIVSLDKSKSINFPIFQLIEHVSKIFHCSNATSYSLMGCLIAALIAKTAQHPQLTKSTKPSQAIVWQHNLTTKNYQIYQFCLPNVEYEWQICNLCG